MENIYNLIIWVKYNKSKFLFIDTIVLVINLTIFNIIHYGYLMNLDILIMFIVVNLFCCLIYFFLKFWLIFTKKYDFLFIPTGNLGKNISYFFVIIFLLLNIIFIVSIWIVDTFFERGGLQFYFSVPWLVLIGVNMYDDNSKNLENRNFA